MNRRWPNVQALSRVRSGVSPSTSQRQSELSDESLLNRGSRLHQFDDQIRSLTRVRSLTARLFTRQEQAQNHVHVGNVGLSLRVIVSWIAERLRQRGRQPTGCGHGAAHRACSLSHGARHAARHQAARRVRVRRLMRCGSSLAFWRSPPGGESGARRRRRQIWRGPPPTVARTDTAARRRHVGSG